MVGKQNKKAAKNRKKLFSKKKLKKKFYTKFDITLNRLVDDKNKQSVANVKSLSNSNRRKRLQNLYAKTKSALSRKRSKLKKNRNKIRKKTAKKQSSLRKSVALILDFFSNRLNKLDKIVDAAYDKRNDRSKETYSNKHNIEAKEYLDLSKANSQQQLNNLGSGISTKLKNRLSLDQSIGINSVSVNNKENMLANAKLHVVKYDNKIANKHTRDFSYNERNAKIANNIENASTKKEVLTNNNEALGKSNKVIQKSNQLDNKLLHIDNKINRLTNSYNKNKKLTDKLKQSKETKNKNLLTKVGKNTLTEVGKNRLNVISNKNIKSQLQIQTRKNKNIKKIENKENIITAEIKRVELKERNIDKTIKKINKKLINIINSNNKLKKVIKKIQKLKSNIIERNIRTDLNSNIKLNTPTPGKRITTAKMHLGQILNILKKESKHKNSAPIITAKIPGLTSTQALTTQKKLTPKMTTTSTPQKSSTKSKTDKHSLVYVANVKAIVRDVKKKGDESKTKKKIAIINNQNKLSEKLYAAFERKLNRGVLKGDVNRVGLVEKSKSQLFKDKKNKMNIKTKIDFEIISEQKAKLGSVGKTRDENKHNTNLKRIIKKDKVNIKNENNANINFDSINENIKTIAKFNFKNGLLNAVKSKLKIKATKVDTKSKLNNILKEKLRSDVKEESLQSKGKEVLGNGEGLKNAQVFSKENKKFMNDLYDDMLDFHSSKETKRREMMLDKQKMHRKQRLNKNLNKEASTYKIRLDDKLKNSINKVNVKTNKQLNNNNKLNKKQTRLEKQSDKRKMHIRGNRIIIETNKQLNSKINKKNIKNNLMNSNINNIAMKINKNINHKANIKTIKEVKRLDNAATKIIVVTNNKINNKVIEKTMQSKKRLNNANNKISMATNKQLNKVNKGIITTKKRVDNISNKNKIGLHNRLNKETNKNYGIVSKKKTQEITNKLQNSFSKATNSKNKRLDNNNNKSKTPVDKKQPNPSLNNAQIKISLTNIGPVNLSESIQHHSHDNSINLYIKRDDAADNGARNASNGRGETVGTTAVITTLKPNNGMKIGKVFVKDVLGYCKDNPCKNSAVCHPQPFSFPRYSCSCLLGFYGTLCEYDTPACVADPCMNGGTCAKDSADPRGYTCICLEGYTAASCELPAENADKNQAPAVPGGVSTHPPDAEPTEMATISHFYVQTPFLAFALGINLLVCMALANCAFADKSRIMERHKFMTQMGFTLAQPETEICRLMMRRLRYVLCCGCILCPCCFCANCTEEEGDKDGLPNSSSMSSQRVGSRSTLRNPPSTWSN